MFEGNVFMDTPLKNNCIFALDIGTRTVIGVVCIKEGNKLKVVAESMLEHDSRSMLDGQVHDVDKVAEVVTRVKQELEGKVGFPLKDVAIAAAGRTLKTRCVHVEQDLGDEMDIDSTVINGLELSGVSEANSQIKEESRTGKDNFYCVGYSIVSYYLNGYSITNLLGHRARYIGADVLATFLPQSVVNSLYRVLEKSGLSVMSLTLEPIAAIEAVVPDNIRLLNIALIDIGAGTSDIAITKRGAIVGYSMVPVAGDEVTEAIAEEYLVDFNTAEAVKRGLGRKKKVSFKDITGLKRTVSGQEVMDIIENTANKIAGEVSETILQYNGDVPKAVFCVGGGSQTPCLIDGLSKKLNIDKSRIAVKKRDSILNLETSENLVSGPEGVTVIGIAIIAMKKVGHDFINVYVNGKEYRLFNSGDLKVYDVLGLIGYNASALIGRSGKSVKFTLNGESRRVPGNPPTPPEIYVNDKAASLDAEVKNGDYISIKDAVDGKDALPKVLDYIRGLQAVSYSLNGHLHVIEPECRINGNLVGYEDSIKDEDKVSIKLLHTVVEQADKYGIRLDGKKIFVNLKPVPGSYSIKDGDEVIISDDDIVVKDVPVKKEKKEEKTLKEAAVSSDIYETFVIVTVNGRGIKLKGSKPIFTDIFNLIDFDLSKPQGNIRLKLNGADAGYADILKNGDNIEVYWDKG